MSLYRALPLVLSFLATPALAQESETAAPQAMDTLISARASLTLSLDSAGDIERRTVAYQCDNEQTLSVQYLNAAPNVLSLVPVDGESLIFASAL